MTKPIDSVDLPSHLHPAHRRDRRRRRGADDHPVATARRERAEQPRTRRPHRRGTHRAGARHGRRRRLRSRRRARRRATSIRAAPRAGRRASSGSSPRATRRRRRSTSTPTTSELLARADIDAVTISPPRSPARRGRAARAARREGRLPPEAVHDDARRGRHAPRRRGEVGTHPPGRKPAALVGTERAVPEGGGVRAQRTRRQAAPRRDRTADRSHRARRAAAAGAVESQLRHVARTDAGGVLHRAARPSAGHWARRRAPTCSRGPAGCATRTTRSA